MRFLLVLGRLGVDVLDEQVKNQCRCKLLKIMCVNRLLVIVDKQIHVQYIRYITRPTSVTMQ